MSASAAGVNLPRLPLSSASSSDNAKRRRILTAPRRCPSLDALPGGPDLGAAAVGSRPDRTVLVDTHKAGLVAQCVDCARQAGVGLVLEPRRAFAFTHPGGRMKHRQPLHDFARSVLQPRARLGRGSPTGLRQYLPVEAFRARNYVFPPPFGCSFEPPIIPLIHAACHGTPPSDNSSGRDGPANRVTPE